MSLHLLGVKPEPHHSLWDRDPKTQFSFSREYIKPYSPVQVGKKRKDLGVKAHCLQISTKLLVFRTKHLPLSPAPTSGSTHDSKAGGLQSLRGATGGLLSPPSALDPLVLTTLPSFPTRDALPIQSHFVSTSLWLYWFIPFLGLFAVILWQQAVINTYPLFHF